MIFIEQIQHMWQSDNTYLLTSSQKPIAKNLRIGQLQKHLSKVTGIPEEHSAKSYETLKKTYYLYKFLQSHDVLDAFQKITSECAFPGKFTSANLRVLASYKYKGLKAKLTKKFIKFGLKRLIGDELEKKVVQAKQFK